MKPVGPKAGIPNEKALLIGKEGKQKAVITDSTGTKNYI